LADLALRDQELLSHLGWFIRVRWLFCAGHGLTVAFGAFVLKVDLPFAKAVGVGAFIFTYNLGFFLYNEYLRGEKPPPVGSGRMEAALQIGLDLFALTCLIHYAGGAENPLVIFYLLHAIVGSMLLTKGEAWIVGLAAFMMFLTVAVLEYCHVLPHYHAEGISGAPSHRGVPFLAVVSLALFVALGATISITSTIVDSLRLREQQLLVTQRALVKKSAELERANATLTEKQRQLVHTEKQASLGPLVAGIAHEINNPIQFIYGNMAILSEAFTDVMPLLDEQSVTRPEFRIARLDYPYFRKQIPVLLKDMADGAARIGAIVRDLKTFARRDEGRFDDDVDLNEAVLASLRLLHNRLRHLDVEEEMDPNLPKLRGNLAQIQQVVVNTLQNAAEALHDDVLGTIRIRTRIEEGGEHVRLSIEDSGSGIAPEVRSRIFDPFFTTKQRTGGTGLGLAITYGIIQQHGGRVEVESQVGKGTVFHYLLPVAQDGRV
jgi:signal transduction histidine kinase